MHTGPLLIKPGEITVQWNLDSAKGLGKFVRYIEHLHLTYVRENYQNVRYIEV